MGATNQELPPLNEVVQRALSSESGATKQEIEELTESWNKSAGICTYYDAVANALSKLPDSQTALAQWKRYGLFNIAIIYIYT